MKALRRPTLAHHRALAERLRHERRRDLAAALGLVAVVLLVLAGLPAG